MKPGSVFRLICCVVLIPFLASAEDDLPTLTSFVADTVGVSSSDVLFRPHDSAFHVKGKAAVSFDDAKMLHRLYSLEGEIRPTGGRPSFVVARAHASNIRIYAQAQLPEDWVRALDRAIEHWNGAGLGFSITRVTHPRHAHVIVDSTFSQSNSVAVAYFPDYYGRPGKTLTVNRYWNGMKPGLKAETLTHRLGLILGMTRC